MSDILADEMTGGKVLVFAHHRNVLDALEQGVLRTGRVEYIRIDGRTKVKTQHARFHSGIAGSARRRNRPKYCCFSARTISCRESLHVAVCCQGSFILFNKTRKHISVSSDELVVKGGGASTGGHVEQPL